MFIRFIKIVTLSILFFGMNPVEATIHNITISNNFFSPLGTTIAPGDTVRWTWVGGIQHNTTSEIGSPKTWASITSSQAGFVFELAFPASDGPGPFPYLCTIHPFSMKDTIFVNIPPTPTIFGFRLDSKQAAACVGSGTGNSGYGLAILSPDSSQLSMHLYHNVVSPTLADIHSGAQCSTGPIEFEFDNPTSPVSQTVTMTPALLTDLFAGNLYVDVHSAPGFSEDIRGQIVQEPLNFIYTLDESQIPGGTGTGSLATGLGVGTLSADGSTFTSKITHNVSNVTEAHIHLGPADSSGPVRYSFGDPASGSVEVWSLDTTNIMELFSGGLYMNVHSSAFPNGEIRSQIIPSGGVFVTTLNGAQAAGGVGTGSDSVGFSVITLSPDQCTFTIHVEHNVANVTEAHIHLGDAGVEGPIRFGFINPTSPIDETWTLTPQNLQDFIDEKLYVNIHSSAFLLGEIRGQIIPTARQTFDLELDESQTNDCLGNGSSATGQAMVELTPGGKQINTQITHNVVNVTEAHIHKGPLCTTGPVRFGFASPVSPIVEIWRPGTDDIISLMQGQLYLNIHSLDVPLGEIRAQIENPPGCCVGTVGNVDNDGGVDIADLTFLIDHLFINFPDVPCPEEGNIDNDGGTDIADLTFLIDHLFINFPVLPNCP